MFSYNLNKFRFSLFREWILPLLSSCELSLLVFSLVLVESLGRLHSIPPAVLIISFFFPLSSSLVKYMALDSNIFEFDLDGDLMDLSLSDPLLPSFNEHTMIGQVISDKLVNFKAIKTILLNAWDYGSEIHITPLDRKKFVVSFPQVQDKNKVIAASPWAVKGCIVILKQWEPDLALADLQFQHSPFWVQIHNIPLNRMNLDNAVVL